MGRSGIRRRKTPRHLAKLPGPLKKYGTTEHSPWTVEGRIEAIGQMGHGLKNASRSQQRFFNRLVVITIGALVVVALAAWFVNRIAG